MTGYCCKLLIASRTVSIRVEGRNWPRDGKETPMALAVSINSKISATNDAFCDAYRAGVAPGASC